MQGEILERQISYWRKELQDTPMLELYTDKIRPPISTHQGSTYNFTLSNELTAKLKHLSQQQGVTLFMTLISAFKILLFRYTGQTDFAVGTPIANRNRPELEPLIGFFVSILITTPSFNTVFLGV